MTTRGPRRAEGAAMRELPEGDAVVLAPTGEQALVLNAVGATLFSLCDGARTLDELVAVVGGCFPEVEPPRVRADVEAFLARLDELGCLSR